MRRHGKGAEPMPFAVVDRIIVDPVRSAEGRSAIRAANEHDIAAGGRTAGDYAGQHIYIVIRRTPGAIRCDKNLTYQSFGIDKLAALNNATQAHRRNSVEGRSYRGVAGITGAKRPDLAIAVDSADKQVAVRIHIRCAPDRRIGKKDRVHPGGSTVGRAAKLSSAVVISGGAPTLVLEPVSDAVGVIDSEPLLVPAGGRSKVSPGLAAIHRAPHA